MSRQIKGPREWVLDALLNYTCTEGFHPLYRNTITMEVEEKSATRFPRCNTATIRSKTEARALLLVAVVSYQRFLPLWPRLPIWEPPIFSLPIGKRHIPNDCLNSKSWYASINEKPFRGKFYVSTETQSDIQYSEHARNHRYQRHRSTISLHRK